MIVPATKATGLHRELLDAYAKFQETDQARTAALARFRAVLDQIEARDRDRANEG